MKASQALGRTATLLNSQQIEDALLEAEVLLRHALGQTRTEFFLHQEEPLEPAQEAALQQSLSRRLQGEPVAYILGQQEFFGLDFLVDRRVLIPRPESELLVEKALELGRRFRRIPLLADTGTGSGNLAIALALNLPQAQIYATDISSDALEIARLNCQRHGVAERVWLLQGDLLSPLPQPVDIIVANLPYVAGDSLPYGRGLFEPAIALEAGRDGLDIIRRFLAQVPGKLRAGGSFLLEVGIGQGAKVKEMVSRQFPGSRVELVPDLARIPRVVIATP